MEALIATNKGIKNIEDNSDSMLNRMLIEFNNGLKLSVINGHYAHCDSEDEFEMAIIDIDGELTDKYFNDEDRGGDETIGYCNAKKVNDYIEKLSSLNC